MKTPLIPENPAPAPPAVEQETVMDDLASEIADKILVNRHITGIIRDDYRPLDTANLIREVIARWEKEPSGRNALNLQLALDALRRLYKAANQSICEYGSTRTLWATFVRDTAWDGLKGFQDARAATDGVERDSPRQLHKSSPSSPLPEEEEDSAPTAQPQSDRTKDTTGQATSI